MKWKIRLSSNARYDVQSALEWTLSNFGSSQHDEYLDRIRIALTDIALNPTSLRSRKRPEVHKDVWIFHLGRKGRKAGHFFVYRIKAGGGVQVGRFLHDSMDLPRHLSEGFGEEN